MTTPHPTAVIRQLIQEPRTLVVPGAHDALVARILELEGFDAIYAGGHGAAAASYGLPDIGLVTQTEMAAHVDRIASAVSIPVIADADEAYGDVINVVRTVRRFERAGAAAIQIEDQAFPKRCGHIEGKRVIPREAMVTKLQAALAARVNPQTVIIARTDAIAVTGIADAIARLQAYEAAGADVLFPDAVQSTQELESICSAVTRPVLVNMTEGGKTPLAELNVLREIGVRIVIYPSSALFASTYAARLIARTLRETGSTASVLDHMVLLPEFNEIAGLSNWQATEDRLVRADIMPSGLFEPTRAFQDQVSTHRAATAAADD